MSQTLKDLRRFLDERLKTLEVKTNFLGLSQLQIIDFDLDEINNLVKLDIIKFP